MINRISTLVLLIGFGSIGVVTPAAASDNDRVIRSDDDSGMMVSIHGGEAGRDLLEILINRSQDANISAQDRLIAALLEDILINRWRQLAK